MPESSHGRAGRGRPKALRGFLRHPGGSLERIGERTRQLSRWQSRLEASLPRQCVGHWQLARLDADELAIIAESPVWASQLRYRQDLLLDSAAGVLGQRPGRCRITINPPRLQRGDRRPPKLSRNGAQTLRACAADVEDPRLREALLRLASRAGD